jgi:hypothetical protein
MNDELQACEVSEDSPRQKEPKTVREGLDKRIEEARAKWTEAKNLRAALSEDVLNTPYEHFIKIWRLI